MRGAETNHHYMMLRERRKTRRNRVGLRQNSRKLLIRLKIEQEWPEKYYQIQIIFLISGRLLLGFTQSIKKCEISNMFESTFTVLKCT